MESYSSRLDTRIMFTKNKFGGEKDMNVDSKRLFFVIMPFDRKFDIIYRKIKKTAENEGFYCTRADETAKGIILKDIFNDILNAFVIVADVTEKNPNVFYELGVAHTLGRKTIMISQNKDIPYNISFEHVLFYNNVIGGDKTLVRKLRILFRYLLGGGKIDNAVQISLRSAISAYYLF